MKMQLILLQSVFFYEILLFNKKNLTILKVKKIQNKHPKSLYINNNFTASAIDSIYYQLSNDKRSFFKK